MLAFVSSPGKGTILDRMKSILTRANDLTPLAEPVRQVLFDANKRRALAGVDPTGEPLAKLAPATIKDRTRKGYPAGPPLVRKGVNSSLIAKCSINVTIARGRVTLLKGWPQVDFMMDHITGRPNLPQRDVLGYGVDEIKAVRAMLPNYVMGRGT